MAVNRTRLSFKLGNAKNCMHILWPKAVGLPFLVKEMVCIQYYWRGGLKFWTCGLLRKMYFCISEFMVSWCGWCFIHFDTYILCLPFGNVCWRTLEMMLSSHEEHIFNSMSAIRFVFPWTAAVMVHNFHISVKPPGHLPVSIKVTWKRKCTLFDF